MENKKLLKDYLKKKHPRRMNELSEKDLDFLAEYSIGRESRPNELLNKLGFKKGHDQYFGDNQFALEIKNEIQYIYGRFSSKRKNHIVFDNSFPSFFEWWNDQMDDKGKCHCCYCGVDQDTLKTAFEKRKIQSKKHSFSGNLQIERLDSEAGYNKDNCRFACVVCNNAKSDMFNKDVFKKYFADSIATFWKDIEKDS